MTVPSTSPEFLTLQRALAGRFSLERELGRGGMGIVFLARDVALERPVAIKLLPPALAADASYRERFLREARTAAGLSHPHIVPIHLVEEKDGFVYFVMAFVDGESLGERVRRAGPLKSADVGRLVQEVAWALGYAHGRGVIHRDIKPDNILLDKGSGRALVTDFGIARIVSAGTSSREGEVLGTMQYMSPEQASADAVIDGRADLYSLGVTAFFALTGRLPFEAENPQALIAMHVTQPAPPVRTVLSTVPSRLAEAVDRCLSKDPAARFATGEALAEAIAEAQVARRDVAPSVREFLAVARAGAVQVTALSILWYGVEETSRALYFRSSGMVDLLTPLLVMLGLSSAVAVVRPLLAARAVVRAGLTEQDVAEAAGLGATSRDANVDYEMARARRVGEIFASPPLRIIMLGSVVGLLFVAVPGILGQVMAPNATLGFRIGASGVLLIAFAGYSIFAGLGIAPRWTAAAVTRGTQENASLFRKLWAGPVGRWLFKLAGLGLGKRASAPPPAAAPTEVLLGRAAGELFDQLPREERARLGNVHDVVRGLERVAAALRERRDALAASLADVGPTRNSERQRQLVADLESARSATESRLGAAVTAMENLRIDLLRVRSGVGRADELTAAIEEARELGKTVDHELAARSDVKKLLGD